LVEVEEVDEAQVGIVGAEASNRVIPVAAATRVSTDQDRHVRGRHHSQVHNGLQPGESVPVWSKKRGHAFVMAAMAEYQGREEHLLDC